MKNKIACALALTISGLTCFTTALAKEPAIKTTKPKIEVGFVLDTTGSMGGLIEGAKQKIWSIANDIATAKPAPDIRFALVAYRDRGDEYVVKTFDLTNDLDAVYGQLQSFHAAGKFRDTSAHWRNPCAAAHRRRGKLFSTRCDPRSRKLCARLRPAPR